MRAKYINKTARRRTIRPDGEHIRELRRYRGGRRRRGMIVNLVTGLGAVLAVVCVYLLFIRAG
jgi:hypothetical protein